MVSFKRGAGKEAAGRLTGRGCCWWPPCSLGAASSESSGVRRGHSRAGTSCISCWVLHSSGPSDPLSYRLGSLAAFPRIPLGTGVKFASWARGQAGCMQRMLSCCLVTGLEAKKADSAGLPCTSLLVCGTRLRSPFPTCPPACGHVLTPILLLGSVFGSVTCMLHRLAEAMGAVGQN